MASEEQGKLSLARLTPHTRTTSSGSTVYTYFRSQGGLSEKPSLVLLHGYPQTSYMWRKLIKLLPEDQPLLIPDLPGYGRSSPSQQDHSKRTIGMAILETLSSLSTDPNSPNKIILCGHDRGARVCHRLAVDFAHQDNPELSEPYKDLLSRFELHSTVILDIVPDLTQFNSFSTASIAVARFHWSFLANVAFAVPMIEAYGGGKFVRELILRWGGEHCAAAMEDGDALEVYSRAFEDVEVIKASCEDYAAGAGEDLKRQVEDQDVGRKMAGRVVIVYSEGYLAKIYDSEDIWTKWAQESGCELSFHGIGGGKGHFIPEEAAEEVAQVLHDTVLG